MVPDGVGHRKGLQPLSYRKADLSGGSMDTLGCASDHVVGTLAAIMNDTPGAMVGLPHGKAAQCRHSVPATLFVYSIVWKDFKKEVRQHALAALSALNE